jgi:apolipoprotein D and lipocalin family protein
MMTSRPTAFSVLLVLALSITTGCTGVPPGIAPVQGFDAERYLGTWYEIARLDHRFERGLEQVTATYRRREDGGLAVLNRGFDPVREVWKTAEGRAYFQSAPDLASLQVSFFGPFYGGYHVFALDPDYGWALVSGPTREYLWILARQPRLPDEVLSALIAKAEASGFATDALIFPPPSVPPAGWRGGVQDR